MNLTNPFPLAPQWRWAIWPALIVSVLAVVFFVCWLKYFNEQPVAVNTWAPAVHSPKVNGLPKVSTKVASGSVKTYPAAAKNKLKLPDDILNDSAKQVIEATQVDRSEHKQTVTTVLNTETGETETITRAEPLPWVQFDTRGSVGIYAGIKNGQPAVRLEAKQDLFDIKAVRCGAIASVDQAMSGPVGVDYFAGLGCAYSW